MPLAPLKDPWQQVPLLEDADSTVASTSCDVTTEEQVKRSVNN